MAIFVIRHGETEGNVKRMVQLPEIPLSERGMGQAKRLGSRLAESGGIGRILSSDYARAYMTAEQVAAATDLPIEIETTLRERNFGDLRGRPYTEVGDIFAEGLEPPGGESWPVFYERAARSWDAVRRVADATEGHLAVVTHGLICHAYVARHAQLPDDHGEQPVMGFANTSLTVIDAKHPYRIELLNCSAHLDDATAHDKRSVSGI